MAGSVRQDNIQVRIDFITDESRQYAKTILATKEFNKDLATSQAKLAEYQKQLKSVGEDEARRVTILEKIALEEQKVALNLDKIAQEAKQVEKIDLGKLTPAQLVERARQLEQAIRLIPQSAPQFAALQTELSGVNGQLKVIRDTAKGIHDQGAATGGEAGGGLVGSVVGGVTSAIGVVTAIFATVRGLFGFVKDALHDIDLAKKADEALKTRIAATNGVAQRSFEELKAAAEGLQKVTLFDDEQIKKGQEIFLTFTNIRGAILDQAVPAALDLSTVFQQDVSTSAVQLGKALNDPINGMKALQRVGITFSAAQATTIKSLVETGDVAGAQAIILKELQTEVGGAARTAAEAGLGPFQLLGNRLREVKEGVGELLSKGLGPFQPALERTVVILEGVVDALLHGEEATGKYAGTINTIVLLLKGLGIVLDGLGKLWDFQVIVYEKIAETAGQVVSVFNDMIQALTKIPIIGNVFDVVILTPLRFVKEAITNLPAAWAGAVAAIKQGALNLTGEFQSLILRARIFKTELEASLSIRQETKDRLAQELNDLRSRQAAAAAGKSIGEAFAEGRDKAIADQAAAAAEDRFRSGSDREAIAKKAPFSIGGLTDEEYAKRRKQALELALKEIEANFVRGEIIADTARLKDEISELAYQNRLILLKKTQYEEQLKVYKKFREDESVEALKAGKALLDIEVTIAKSKKRLPDLQPLPAPTVATSVDDTSRSQLTKDELRANEIKNGLEVKSAQDKFVSLLTTEHQYNLQRIKLEKGFSEEKLRILQEAGEGESAEAKKLAQELTAIRNKLVNAERLSAEDERKIHEIQAAQEITLAKDVVSTALELLGQDEAARKKHAGAIKAFEIAQIQINLAGEIQGIWKNANENPLNSIIPGWGPAFAGIQTGLAVIRAGFQTQKIANTKLEQGGMSQFGFFGGRPHSAGGTKGYFEDGTVIEVERDEAFAVVNRKDSATLRALSGINSRHGVPFFAGGGLPTINTTPTSNAPLSGSSSSGIDFAGFSQVVNRFAAAVASMPREVKSRVVLTELETQQSTLNQVRADAAL